MRWTTKEKPSFNDVKVLGLHAQTYNIVYDLMMDRKTMFSVVLISPLAACELCQYIFPQSTPTHRIHIHRYPTTNAHISRAWS